MLGSAYVIAFVPTRDPARARIFYEKTLGLKFVSEDPFTQCQGREVRALSGNEAGRIRSLGLTEWCARRVVQGSGRQYPVCDRSVSPCPV